MSVKNLLSQMLAIAVVTIPVGWTVTDSSLAADKPK
jgi:hypothetical protein